MFPSSRLYDALNDFLSQYHDTCKDLRHVTTLCWMIIGIIQSQDVHLNGFGVLCPESSDLCSVASETVSTLVIKMLFLLLQGTQVVASLKRRWVDPHWQCGMSYPKLGCNWIRLAMTHLWKIPVYWFLSSAPDPHPASASKKQSERSLKREFTVLRCLAAF